MSIHGKTRPCPLHVGHQPRGELNEKFFGSSSGNDSPVSMSVRVVENQDRVSPEGSSRKHEPLPSESARSSEEVRGRMSDVRFERVRVLLPTSELPLLMSDV